MSKKHDDAQNLDTMLNNYKVSNNIKNHYNSILQKDHSTSYNTFLPLQNVLFEQLNQGNSINTNLAQIMHNIRRPFEASLKDATHDESILK